MFETGGGGGGFKLMDVNHSVRSMDEFSIFFNMNVCCLFSVESPY